MDATITDMDTIPDIRILEARGIIIDAVARLAQTLVGRRDTTADEVKLADDLLKVIVAYVGRVANGGIVQIERDRIGQVTDEMVNKIQQLAINVPRAHNGA